VKARRFSLLIYLLVFLVFWIRGAVFLDPDFGWHLRMGQLILSSGIPKTDPFSYTMPSFPFVDHEWLTNVLIAWSYPKIGFFGLAGVFAILGLGALLLAKGNLSLKDSQKAPLWFLGPTFFLLAAAAILPYVGIRPQIISWLFLALFLRFFEESWWKKGSWFLPFLLVLWSNLHGGFPLGILVIFLLVLGESLKKKRFEGRGYLILILSSLVSLINPYGVRLWGEVWQQVSDTSLRWTIAEWQPSIFSFNLPFLGLVVFSLVLVYRFRDKFSSGQLILFLFLLIQAAMSLRHLPLWVLSALSPTDKAITYFFLEIRKIRYGAKRFRKFFLIIFWFSVGTFLFVATQAISESRYFREEIFYPSQAVEFLKNSILRGEIFSSYGWGGYLIWKLPEKKVFIDGRMPSWRGGKMPPGESDYAMKDYSAILSGEIDYRPIFSQYQIKTVLWPQKKLESFWERLDKKLIKFLFKQESKDDFIERLIKDGWVKIYQDQSGVILQKPGEWFAFSSGF